MNLFKTSHTLCLDDTNQLTSKSYADMVRFGEKIKTKVNTQIIEQMKRDNSQDVRLNNHEIQIIQQNTHQNNLTDVVNIQLLEIRELKTEVKSLTSKVEILTTENQQLNNKIETLTTENQQLKTEIVELKTEIVELKTEIRELKTERHNDHDNRQIYKLMFAIQDMNSYYELEKYLDPASVRRLMTKLRQKRVMEAHYLDHDFDQNECHYRKHLLFEKLQQLSPELIRKLKHKITPQLFNSLMTYMNQHLVTYNQAVLSQEQLDDGVEWWTD